MRLVSTNCSIDKTIVPIHYSLQSIFHWKTDSVPNERSGPQKQLLKSFMEVLQVIASFSLHIT